MVDYTIKIKCKKFLGMINKISLNHVKKGINNIVNNNVPSEYYLYTSNQQSSAKNSEYIIIQSCIYVHKYM
ncbi:hypothetical protein [Methanothermococcus okinawensis]|uniref:hypothetical protein n=1 Tax=Methanothermococcus okinawensis TaxID=155863 RepID=UPI0012F64FED|nr:hypothetical protein [Methanothermococcus okinawensis]